MGVYDIRVSSSQHLEPLAAGKERSSMPRITRITLSKKTSYRD